MIRRFFPVFALGLAACTSDGGGPTPEPQSLPAPRSAGHQHGRLAGLGVGELGELLGLPTLQIREGPGLKLQYRGGGCILDAYLYPPVDGRGAERVTLVEARLPSGAATDAEACEAAIERSR